MQKYKSGKVKIRDLSVNLKGLDVQREKGDAFYGDIKQGVMLKASASMEPQSATLTLIAAP